MALSTEQLSALLAAEGFSVVEMEPGVLYTRFAAGDHSWAFVVWWDDGEQRLVAYSTLDEQVPIDRRAAVVDFITRANYGMVLGNFEIDLTDGTVRYKTSIGLDGVEPTAELIREVVMPNLATTERYAGAVEDVVHGRKTPVEALAAADT